MTTHTGGGLFPRREPTGNPLRDHSLSIALVVISAVFWGYDLWASIRILALEEAKQTVPQWLQITHDMNESWMVEPSSLLLIVVLTKWAYERGSAESN